MQERECMIIRDLMPPYIEELTNETTNGIIVQHLQECGKCRKIYQELLEEYEEQQVQEKEKERKFVRKLRRYRYQFLGGFLGVVLTLALAAAGIGWLVWSNRQRNYVDVYTDNVEEYGEFAEYYGISKLELFPAKQEIADSGGIIQRYVYACNGLKLYPGCQIYLECEYTEEGYRKERDRLVRVTDPLTGRQVGSSQELYEYPAVYAMRHAETCQEYALFVEEEKKIIYVYLQGVVDRRELHFQEKYLPLDYGQNGMVYETVEKFSIYPEKEFSGYQ